MKITHIFWSLGFGGIETMLVNIANAQIKEKAQVSIIIINKFCEETLIQSLDKRISIYILGRTDGSIDFRFIIKLNRLLKQIQPDVIHLHRSDIASILNPQFLPKTCVTLHDLPKGEIKPQNILKLLWNKILRKPKPYSNMTYINHIPYIFSISRSVKEELEKQYNIESSVIYNGIETKQFRTKESDIHNTPLRIVMVSRLEHDKKGQDLLIKAASQLQGKVTVDFIGTGSSLEYLKQLVHQLHCEESVKFLGKQDQRYISSHLADYDLFVQPSRWEGFGLTVAEALAAQIPVLASEGQGPAEVICGNKYGWIFENGNVEDLTHKIEYILNHYHEAIEKAKLGKDYVYENFDIHSTANAYLNAYKSIINTQSNHA